MSTTYALHYNPRAGEIAIYDRTAIWTAKFKPSCNNFRGQAEVTADKSKVTCLKCNTEGAK